MNWFERHLNWTFIIAMVLGPVAGFIAALIAPWPFNSVTARDLLAFLVWCAVVGIAAKFVLDRKRRSYWWVLLVWFFSPVWLRGKVGTKVAEKTVTPPQRRTPNL
jgi:uncharacterized membrane protein YeaQ/YmgE (transglycosylase-associated protein family)